MAISNRIHPSDHLQAGIISRIRLENFMCHTSLEIELGPLVNFITGQNGSGKSAILTALCVAFGSRARGTQRAQTLKEFIKTGCSYALVQVDIKNQGEDAFKPEMYGGVIIVERRISESANSIALKNSQGKKMGSKKEDLREIVEHFNIDVENPCVIMSQDKSREFLHSGNAKDKFKFFFKATLLERLYDLLNGIEKQLCEAREQVNLFEAALRPILKELHELDEKIKSMEYVEEISHELELLRKKLAWSYVYDAQRKLDERHKVVEKLKGRTSSCQARIDQQLNEINELSRQFDEKKSQVDNMVGTTSEVSRKKEELEQSYKMALREKHDLEQTLERKAKRIDVMVGRAKSLEKQIEDFQEQCIKDTQAEENEMEDKLRELQTKVDEASHMCQRLKEEEEDITQRMGNMENEIQHMAKKIEDLDRVIHEASRNIDNLKMNQTNKVTAFGGHYVIRLLQTIERYHHRFRCPPIGPIGSHLKLVNGNMWSAAIENAIGGLLEAFIVTDHSDSLTLKQCAREANYNRIKIIIYDFSRPKLVIPRHMLPQTNHPTVFSVLHSDNHVVLNVLVDLAGAERQVLVKNVEVGTAIAFDQKIPNLKEVYTSDGYKMFSRGSAQTILPPFKNFKAGRLSGSFDNQIKDLETDVSEANERVQQYRGVKRSNEGELSNLRNMLASVKRRRVNEERQRRSKEFELQDARKMISSAASSQPASNVDDLHEEISKLRDEINAEEASREKIQGSVEEARSKADDLQVTLKSFVESAKSKVDALAEAEKKLMTIEKRLDEAEAEKKHYEGVLNAKVLLELRKAEAELQELEHECEENRTKVSVFCPESEVEALEGYKESTPEQLSAQFDTLKRRHDRESRRFPESIEDLRMLYEQKERKISRKQQIYKSFREKLDACVKALQLRWDKFRQSASELRKRLTWNFNGNLMKKGISGKSVVSYEEQTLVIEVNMPQDTSSANVRDTRGLSGGERSFSTLCFALALHQMIEAPFRAMDEFDVFMDAVSRKISLDTMVDFALAQGCQWIFITPHDISMVKNDERIKKQQLAAPRG